LGYTELHHYFFLCTVEEITEYQRRIVELEATIANERAAFLEQLQQLKDEHQETEKQLKAQNATLGVH
jgi:septal ring factor EnvC (AmiA/AmiB activator)